MSATTREQCDSDAHWQAVRELQAACEVLAQVAAQRDAARQALAWLLSRVIVHPPDYMYHEATVEAAISWWDDGMTAGTLPVLLEAEYQTIAAAIGVPAHLLLPADGEPGQDAAVCPSCGNRTVEFSPFLQQRHCTRRECAWEDATGAGDTPGD